MKNKNLKITISEAIKTQDVPPGRNNYFEENKEQLPQKEVNKRKKILLEYTRLLSRYVKPHNKKARWVEKKDLPKVIEDGKDLVVLCNTPRGNYAGIAALDHTRINDKDPLRFFVSRKGMVIINPIIFDHTKLIIKKKEECFSYPSSPSQEVPRYNKIILFYQTLLVNDDNNQNKKIIISKPKEQILDGSNGHIFQHEIGHLNGGDIYNKDFKANIVEGLGSGIIKKEEAKKLFKN